MPPPQKKILSEIPNSVTLDQPFHFPVSQFPCQKQGSLNVNHLKGCWESEMGSKHRSWELYQAAVSSSCIKLLPVFQPRKLRLREIGPPA